MKIIQIELYPNCKQVTLTETILFLKLATKNGVHFKFSTKMSEIVNRRIYGIWI